MVDKVFSLNCPLNNLPLWLKWHTPCKNKRVHVRKRVPRIGMHDRDAFESEQSRLRHSPTKAGELCTARSACRPEKGAGVVFCLFYCLSLSSPPAVRPAPEWVGGAPWRAEGSQTTGTNRERLMMNIQPHSPQSALAQCLPCVEPADGVAHVYRATLLEPSPKRQECHAVSALQPLERNEYLCGSVPHRYFSFRGGPGRKSGQRRWGRPHIPIQVAWGVEPFVSMGESMPLNVCPHGAEGGGVASGTSTQTLWARREGAREKQAGQVEGSVIFMVTRDHDRAAGV
ncbi:hypothetical protein DBB_20130 [Desulfoluna spongiiphila]|nr:hypothetical protein DBB_20130 [Desulfoluna spongiiphila]